MKNPFIENGYLLPVASVNRVKIVSSDIPSVNKLLVEESADNKHAWDLISGALFKKRIRHVAQDLDDFILCLKGDRGDDIRQESDMIVRRFARNLSFILLTLKTGSAENRAARREWTDTHWKFWSDLEKIYLCGGMTYDIIGERLLYHMCDLFDSVGFYPYNISIMPNGYASGLEGAKNMLLRRANSGIVFDFGHTYVKRGCFRGNNLHILESVRSKFTGDAESDGELIEMAEALHNFIVEVIAETFSDAGSDTGGVIGVVFANYINNGALYSARGGYAKLSYLADNYQDYLSDVLSERISKPVSAILLHDGTAAAMAVTKNEKAAVVTLGTGLGVGFVDNSYAD